MRGVSAILKPNEKELAQKLVDLVATTLLKNYVLDFNEHFIRTGIVGNIRVPINVVFQALQIHLVYFNNRSQQLNKRVQREIGALKIRQPNIHKEMMGFSAPHLSPDVCLTRFKTVIESIVRFTDKYKVIDFRSFNQLKALLESAIKIYGSSFELFLYEDYSQAKESINQLPDSTFVFDVVEGSWATIQRVERPVNKQGFLDLCETYEKLRPWRGDCLDTPNKKIINLLKAFMLHEAAHQRVVERFSSQKDWEDYLKQQVPSPLAEQYTAIDEPD